MKKVVKSKMAAQKWLWWSDNGRDQSIMPAKLLE